jgi:hypothetical protein
VKPSACFHDEPQRRFIGLVQLQNYRFLVELVDVVHSGVGYCVFQLVNCDGNVKACEFFLAQGRSAP